LLHALVDVRSVDFEPRLVWEKLDGEAEEKEDDGDDCIGDREGPRWPSLSVIRLNMIGSVVDPQT